MLNGLTHRILEPFMSNLHKRQVYSGLFEIIKDDKYYYNSRIGADYSHLTEAGKEAVIEYVNHIGTMMLKKEKEEIEALAKKMVWEELKK